MNFRKFPVLQCSLVALAGSGACISVASAQNAAAVLEEVNVTAERTTQNIQTVPIAITVLNGDALNKQGITRVDDLQRVVPGVTVSNVGRSTAINIRGVGLSQTSPTSSPGIAYYIDGTLIPHETALLGSFYDISSVEVLRGPQGTLSGQNSTGGAIYFRTAEPVMGQWNGNIEQTLGNYSATRTTGAINVPLGSVFAARISAVSENRDSFYTNTGGPSEPGNLNYRGARANLAFSPTENFRTNLRYEYGNSDNDNFAYKPYFAPPGSNPFTISEDADSFNKQLSRRYDAEIHYDIPSLITVRWASSRQTSDNSDVLDADRTAVRPLASPVRGLGGAETEYRIWLHELNLLSNNDSALQWIVGAFYLKDDVETRLVGWRGSYVTPVTPLTTNILAQTHSTSKSVFGQASYEFSPQWKLIAGMRYSRDHQDQDRQLAPAPFLLGFSTAESSAPTGRVALNWTPSQDMMLYASVAKGYKAGGNNLAASDPVYTPEKNVVEELGLKSMLLDQHLRLNLAVFASQYDQIQVQSGHTFPPAPPLFPLTENTGKASSKGAELELEAIFSALRINTSAAYLDSTLDKDIRLNNVEVNQLQNVPAGTTLAFAPKWTVNAGAEYRFRVGAGSLTPRIQASYISSRYQTLFQSDTTLLDARTLIDANIAYTPNDSGRWLIEIFGKNLADKTYVAEVNQGGTSSLGGRGYGAPRQFGARIKVSFD